MPPTSECSWKCSSVCTRIGLPWTGWNCLGCSTFFIREPMPPAKTMAMASGVGIVLMSSEWVAWWGPTSPRLDAEAVQQPRGTAVVAVLVEAQPGQCPLARHRVAPFDQVGQGGDDAVDVADQRTGHPVLVRLEAKVSPFAVLPDVEKREHYWLPEQQVVDPDRRDVGQQPVEGGQHRVHGESVLLHLLLGQDPD